MVNYRSWVQAAKAQLADHNQESQNAEWLVIDLMQWSKLDFLMNQQEDIPPEQLQQLDGGLSQLIHHVPLQYIVGATSFYGRTFSVNDNVLIPRPETEEVVHHFMSQLPDKGCIADIGCGSGVIAITLKLEKPHLTVYGTDISSEALKVTEDNCKAHQCAIHLLQGDGLTPLIEENIRLDGLISNPPYIGVEETQYMDESVLDYEPHIALFAEDNGFAMYKALFEKLPYVLNEGAPVVLEIGFKQGRHLTMILQQMYPHLTPEVILDINGNERIFSFIWSSA
ncbi:peptide chain release factor N(5)-glutamine methyltransferase [Staphylococcus sp. 11261D007BR]